MFWARSTLAEGVLDSGHVGFAVNGKIDVAVFFAKTPIAIKLNDVDSHPLHPSQALAIATGGIFCALDCPYKFAFAVLLGINDQVQNPILDCPSHTRRTRKNAKEMGAS